MNGNVMPERLRWIAGAVAGALLALLTITPPVHAAERHSTQEVIVRFASGVSGDAGSALVEADGGRITRRLDIIDGVGAQVDGGALAALRNDPRVRSVTPNASVAPKSLTGVVSGTTSTATTTTTATTAATATTDAVANVADA